MHTSLVSLNHSPVTAFWQRKTQLIIGGTFLFFSSTMTSDEPWLPGQRAWQKTLSKHSFLTQRWLPSKGKAYSPCSFFPSSLCATALDPGGYALVWITRGILWGCAQITALRGMRIHSPGAPVLHARNRVCGFSGHKAQEMFHSRNRLWLLFLSASSLSPSSTHPKSHETCKL